MQNLIVIASAKIIKVHEDNPLPAWKLWLCRKLNITPALLFHIEVKITLTKQPYFIARPHDFLIDPTGRRWFVTSIWPLDTEPNFLMRTTKPVSRKDIVPSGELILLGRSYPER